MGLMTTLLSDSSPLYRRRLARALNSLPDGFYLVGGNYPGNLRCRRAAYRKGYLQVIPCGETAFLSTSAGSEFIDAYGRSVVASRKA